MNSGVFDQALTSTLWQSSLLFVLVALATRWLRDSSPSTRHALWLLVLARLLLPAAPVLEASVNVETWAWSTNPLVLTSLDDDTPTASAAATQVPASSGGNSLVASPAAARAVPWFAVLWALGALAVAACAALQWWRLRRLCAESRPASAPWSRRLAVCAAQVGVTRHVALRVGEISAPMTVGVFSPTILVPTGLAEQLADDQRDAVLVHELVHIERRDLLVHALSTVARIAFFFHPVAWWTSRRLEHERELVADGEAMRCGGTSARRYGETLVAVACFSTSQRENGDAYEPRRALAMTSGGRALANRLRRLGQPADRRGAWVTWPLVAVTIAVVGQACLSPAADHHKSSLTIDFPTYLEQACSERSIVLPTVGPGIPIASREVRGVALVTRTGAEVREHLAPGGWLPVARQLPEALIEIVQPVSSLEPTEAAPPERTELALDSAGMALNGLSMASVDDVIAQLDSARSLRVVLRSDPAMPFGEVAAVVARIVALGHVDVVFAGINVSTERRAALAGQLAMLPKTDMGELLVLTDRSAPWARHLELVRAASEAGIAHLSFVARDDNGRLVRVPQDLPTDVGVSASR